MNVRRIWWWWIFYTVCWHYFGGGGLLSQLFWFLSFFLSKHWFCWRVLNYHLIGVYWLYTGTTSNRLIWGLENKCTSFVFTTSKSDSVISVDCFQLIVMIYESIMCRNGNNKKIFLFSYSSFDRFNCLQLSSLFLNTDKVVVSLPDQNVILNLTTTKTPSLNVHRIHNGSILWRELNDKCCKPPVTFSNAIRSYVKKNYIYKITKWQANNKRIADVLAQLWETEKKYTISLHEVFVRACVRLFVYDRTAIACFACLIHSKSAQILWMYSLSVWVEFRNLNQRIATIVWVKKNTFTIWIWISTK